MVVIQVNLETGVNTNTALGGGSIEIVVGVVALVAGGVIAEVAAEVSDLFGLERRGSGVERRWSASLRLSIIGLALS